MTEKVIQQCEDERKIKVKPSDLYVHITCLFIAIFFLCFKSTIYHTFLLMLRPFSSSSNNENWSNILMQIDHEKKCSFSCPLYVVFTSLSINYSVALYVGQSYAQQDIIDFNTVENHTVRVWNYINYTSIPVYNLLSKQNKKFSNVHSNGSVIRDIYPFEELLYHSYMSSSFLDDENYNIAYSIIQNSWNSFHDSISIKDHFIFSLSQATLGKTSRRITSRDSNVSYNYNNRFWKIIQEVVKKINSPLAKYLPSTEEEARQLLFPNTKLPIGVQTVGKTRKWIQKYGICYNQGLFVSFNETPISAYSIRDIRKGDTIETTPLYTVSTQDQELYTLCQNMVVQSLEYPNVTFCPLSNVAFLRHGEESQCLDIESLNQCGKEKNANGKLKFISLLGNRNKQGNKYTTEDLLEKPVVALMLTVIATQNIQKGEEVLINYYRSTRAKFISKVENVLK